MCISFGQKDFRYNDILKSDSKWSQLIQLAQKLNPNNYRVNMWKKGVIYTSSLSPEIRTAQFTWLEEKSNGKPWPVFNVRAEGGWNNKENDINFKGPYHIYKNPYVKDLLQYQRCIVPCDFFIEQPEDKKRKQKFLIRKQDLTPIHLGGIFKEEVDADTGECNTYFALITTPPTPATLQADHHRSPLVVDDEKVFDFLNPQLTGKELNKFFQPNHSIGYEVFEVDPEITGKKQKFADDDPAWIQPLI